MKKFFDFKNVFFVVCLSALLVACSKQEQIERDRPVVQVARAYRWHVSLHSRVM